MSKYKIALVVAYFGKLPKFFELWLESCKYNPTIDWIIFTDDKKKYKYPDNVIVRYTTFEELKDRFQKKFDFKIELSHPYKLCDYKAAYGDIFREELEIYYFWGYCDVDLVWGNIRKFLKDNILEKYDKFFCNGHLSIYRNLPEVNKWYKNLKGINKINYKKVYTSKLIYGFEEWRGKLRWGGINEMIKNSKKSHYINRCFDDILVKYSNFCSYRKIEGVNINFRKIYKYNSAYTFDKGTLLQHILVENNIIKTETMYVHFQKRKMDLNLTNKLCDRFAMIPNKFIDYSEIDMKFIKKKCKYNIIYPQYIVMKFNNLKRKILKGY